MRIPLAVFCLLAWTAGGAFPLSAQTIVVSPYNMQGWAFLQEVPNGAGALVNGPATPPLGKGSVQLSVDNTGRMNISTAAYAGVALADLTAISYHTYSAPANVDSPPVWAISLQMDIDYDLTDTNYAWQGRLVFEPYYNGTVAKGVWQSWDAKAGRWWASGAPGNTQCPQSAPCTLSQVLSFFPNAGIRLVPLPDNTFLPGLLHLRAGGPWPNFSGNADALTIGVSGNDTTYNFELGPQNKDDCKNGGWEGYFRNQGQCVSYFLSKRP